MTIKLKMDRYRLANALRAAAAMYKECAGTAPELTPAFQSMENWCIERAEELEGYDILGDCIMLEG